MGCFGGPTGHNWSDRTTANEIEIAWHIRLVKLPLFVTVRFAWRGAGFTSRYMRACNTWAQELLIFPFLRRGCISSDIVASKRDISGNTHNLFRIFLVDFAHRENFERSSQWMGTAAAQ